MLNRRLLSILRQYGHNVCWIVGEIVQRVRGATFHPFTGTAGGRTTRISNFLQECLEKGEWVLGPDDRPLNVRTKYDKLLPWLANRTNYITKHPEALNCDPDSEWSCERSLTVWEEKVAMHLSDIADWVSATNVNLMGERYSIDAAIEGAEEWHDELAATAVDTDVEQGNVILQWPDGWSVQELDTDSLRADEGTFMGHCVGGGTYDEGIFSLRDPLGRPRVTIQLDVYKNLTEAIRQLNFKMPWSTSSDNDKQLVLEASEQKPDGYRWNWYTPQDEERLFGFRDFDAYVYMDPYDIDPDFEAVIEDWEIDGDFVTDKEVPFKVWIHSDGELLLDDEDEERFYSILAVDPGRRVQVQINVVRGTVEALVEDALSHVQAEYIGVEQVKGRRNNLIARWSLCERLIEFFNYLNVPWYNDSTGDFHDCYYKWVPKKLHGQLPDDKTDHYPGIG